MRVVYYYVFNYLISWNLKQEWKKNIINKIRVRKRMEMARGEREKKTLNFLLKMKTRRYI